MAAPKNTKHKHRTDINTAVITDIDICIFFYPVIILSLYPLDHLRYQEQRTAIFTVKVFTKICGAVMIILVDISMAIMLVNISDIMSYWLSITLA